MMMKCTGGLGIVLSVDCFLVNGFQWHCVLMQEDVDLLKRNWEGEVQGPVYVHSELEA